MANYKIDPDKRFVKSIDKAIKEVGDLVAPFKLITNSWYKGNKAVFPQSAAGKGKWDDLAPSTKKTKTRILGSPYPILRFSGTLAESMTVPSDSDAISKVINKTILILGTSVKGKGGTPYPFFLNDGTKKMPARPFMFFGPEQLAPSAINKRQANWIKVIGKHVIDTTAKAI